MITTPTPRPSPAPARAGAPAATDVPRCREKRCGIPLVTAESIADGRCWFCRAASPAPVRRRPHGRRC